MAAMAGTGRLRLAITGGTGFVGAHLIAAARDAGHEVTALTRRGGADGERLRWVPGALDDAPSLARLAAGADAVIHVAGVVSAPDAAGFAAGNIAGTEAMLAAARAAGVPRFVHVSSLAAREPALSRYGWSKAQGEACVAAGGLDATIVRPPAIYGPGDREMLELFRAARTGVLPLPPGGRLSVIAVADLCALLLALAPPGTPPDASRGATLEPDDGVTEGWTHRALARAIGAAVGRPRLLALPLPGGVLRAGAAIDGWLRGPRAKLTPDRVAYFRHPDWVVRARPDPALWVPRIPTPAGLAATAAWYRAQGWL